MKNLNKLTRGIVVLSLLAFVGVVGCSDSDTGSSDGTDPALAEIPATANQTAGEASYNMLCQGCHGVDGTGSINGPSLVGSSYVMGNFAAMQTKITDTMPPGGASACDDSDGCSANVAAYIFCSFNPGVADGC